MEFYGFCLKDAVELLALIVAVIAIVMSTRTASKSLKCATDLTDKLVRNMMFMDFTKRYNDWISSIPLDLNDGNGSSGNHRTKNHVRMYFDLCSEEYYMYRKGLIEDVVWKYWTEGMRDAFKIYKLGNFWQGELGQFYNEGFKHFVTNEVLRNNAPH